MSSFEMNPVKQENNIKGNPEANWGGPTQGHEESKDKTKLLIMPISKLQLNSFPTTFI